MFARYHVAKAERLEATLQKLDITDDYEMIIELCMLAGTHYLNAALHADGISHQMQDQAHTSMPSLESLSKTPRPEIMAGVAPLAHIEGVRPKMIRGAAPYDRTQVEQCLKCFDQAKEAFLAVIGLAGQNTVWEPKKSVGMQGGD